MNKEELIQLLHKYHLKPEKKLGQHYLIDENVLASIIEAANIRKDENVLEIGAGPGGLTKALAKAGADVLAVEFDRDFCRLLQEEFHNWRNVHVLCADALRLDFQTKRDYKLRITDYELTPDGELAKGMSEDKFAIRNSQSLIDYHKIVANIPYQITNPLVRKILEPGSVIEEAVLLIQKEVAERLSAPPGSADRGILTIMVEMYGGIEKIVEVPAKAFWPEPKVNSTVIRLRRIMNKELRIKTSDEEKAFFWFVKQGFSGKRKTLINSLSGGLQLPKSTASAIVEEAGVDALARAEDVKLEQWLRLFSIFKERESGKKET